MSNSFKESAIILNIHYTELNKVNDAIYFTKRLRQNKTKSENECNEELVRLYEQKRNIENHIAECLKVLKVV